MRTAKRPIERPQGVRLSTLRGYDPSCEPQPQKTLEDCKKRSYGRLGSSSFGSTGKESKAECELVVLLKFLMVGLGFNRVF